MLLLSLNFVLLSTLLFSANDNHITLNNDSVYMGVEVQAQFPGGIPEAFKFLKQHLQYPESSLKNKIEGRVIVKFIIRSNGKADNYNIIEGINQELDSEAVRVIKSFPDWIPAKISGKNVSSYYDFPVSFIIDKPQNRSIPEDTMNISVPLISIPVVIDSLLMPDNFNVASLNMDFITSGTFEKPYPKAKQTEMAKKFGMRAMNGVLFLNSIKPGIISLNKLDSLKKEMNLVDASTELTVFNGGKSEFAKYINENLRYRVNAQELQLEESNVLHFVIDSTGNLVHIGFQKEGLKLFQLEIENLIKSIKNWIPYTLNNKRCNTFISIPYSFTIEKNKIGVVRLFDVQKEEGSYQPIVMLDNIILPDKFDVSLLELNNLITLKSKPRDIKFSFQTKSNPGMVETIQYLDSTKIVNGDVVFQVVEQMPIFPGGDPALFQYLIQNIKYPEISKLNNEEERVILTFVISQTGDIVNVEVVRGRYPMLIDEALRLIKTMPNWIPGKQRGKPVAVKYMMPVNFKLQ